jgi:hypothetical protein
MTGAAGGSVPGQAALMQTAFLLRLQNGTNQCPHRVVVALDRRSHNNSSRASHAEGICPVATR